MYERGDDDIADQLKNLPAGALAAFAELRATLEVAPWSGFVYYLILDDQRRVDLLELRWLG